MNCGGMDQTVSILGQLDKALSIQFEPSIEIEYVDLSSRVTFVIANSLTLSIKSESSYKHYNKRVIECRIGLHLLIRHLQIPPSIQLHNIAQLQKHINYSNQQMLDLVKVIQKGFFDQKQLEQMLQIKDLKEILTDINNCELVLNNNDDYNIQDRIHHVVSEHMRV